MIHFVDNKGTIIKTIESPVYQGSAESNNIILIAPFAANLQFTVAFFLPNGEITPRYAMTQGGTLNGVEYAPTNGAMAIWTFSMPNNITQYFGTVYAQFYAYGTNGQITASSRTSFVVARGVPEELPDTPDQTIYNQILTALSQINTALNNGSYAARAIYWWINTYTYGMNEITFYPIGTYGAFVRSTVTGNTGNQPYNDDGVLDSAHWQEIVNFNKIYAAEQNAITQAQAAAESAQNAEASASAAAQSAQDAADSANSIGQSEQNAAQSAQAAAESAQAAAESASKAEGIFQNATMKNEAEVIRAPWDFDTQYGDIEFYYENKDTRYVSTNGVTFDVNYNNGDYIKTTKYDRTNIDYQVSESTTYTLEFPEKSGTLALTSDVAAEASERESADNALQSDIDGIQQQLSETQHFRGYYETTAQVQSISNPHSGDYAWNAQTGTVWNYSTSWSDSGVAIPDQTVPKSTTTPLMDGTATLGSTNTYADGAHRHPTDTTRASVTALNSETKSRTAADSNLQSQIDDIKDGTTVVGRATNVTSQINGHDISDIFESDGTTVKNASEAETAEIANRTGSIVIQNNADLNDCTANINEVQVYTCQTNATAATLLNCPVDVTFTMWATRAFEEQSNGSRDFQFLIATNNQCYYRVRSGGTTWDNWRTLVESDGSYPTLGAGHLPNNYIYAGESSDPKWYKIATISNAPNLAAASLLLSINGIFATQDNQYGAETGQIEFDAANASGTYSCSATLNYGNINTNNVCVVQNGSTAELYYHFDSAYQAILVTAMSFYGGSTASYELTNEGVSAAPSNAIYAVNRNVSAKGVTPATGSDSDDVATTEWVNNKILNDGRKNLIFDEPVGQLVSASGMIIGDLKLDSSKTYELVLQNAGVVQCRCFPDDNHTVSTITYGGYINSPAATGTIYRVAINPDSDNDFTIRVFSAPGSSLGNWTAIQDTLYKIYEMN